MAIMKGGVHWMDFLLNLKSLRCLTPCLLESLAMKKLGAAPPTTTYHKILRINT